MKILIEFAVSIYLSCCMYKGFHICKKVYLENKMKQEYITQLMMPLIFIFITQSFVLKDLDTIYILLSVIYIVLFILFILFFVFRIYILQFKNRL